MNKIPYQPYLKELARKLRNEGTPGEAILWPYLKNKNFMGYRFHRQKPILNYIVDFFSSELMLAIELDGYSHDERQEYDKKRDQEISALGITVIRFQESDVRFNIDDVLRGIRFYIEEHQETQAPR